jgi:hypothetical protein
MSPKKRPPKKSKPKRSKKGKKPARAKKTAVRRKKSSSKKKSVRTVKRVAASAVTHRGALASADTLGQWPAENEVDAGENEPSEDDIPPEYGGNE